MEKNRTRCSYDWKIWRGEVFERDKYTCQECGKSGIPIEPHHIEPRRLGEKDVFNKDNGITLCRPCHQKTIWKEQDFTKRYKTIVNRNTSLSNKKKQNN